MSGAGRQDMLVAARKDAAEARTQLGVCVPRAELLTACAEAARSPPPPGPARSGPARSPHASRSAPCVPRAPLECTPALGV